MRIYSYQKDDTNEYPNIFVSKKLYEYDTKNICIGKYLNIQTYLYNIFYVRF